MRLAVNASRYSAGLGLVGVIELATATLDCIVSAPVPYIGGVPREDSVDENVHDEHGDDVVEGEAGLA